MKKKIVLIALFVLPIVAYLFFASGIYNFANLPVASEEVEDVTTFASQEVKAVATTEAPLTFNDHITLVGYLGNELMSNEGYTANLNLMIYKYFERYEDFQMILFVTPGNREEIENLKTELARIFDVSKMRFIEATIPAAEAHFESLGTGLSMMSNGAHPDVFIIDRDLALRSGHNEKKQNDYGYDFSQAVEMGYLKDDVKILLAEYRLALKKNNNASPELEQRRPKKED